MATITTQKDLLNHEATRFAMLLHAYKECAPEVQEIVSDMAEIIVDDNSSSDEREHATDALVEALLPGLTAEVREFDDIVMESDAARMARGELDAEEECFADRLRGLMKERGITQEKLAALTGVGQPAISNMLNRRCRPQPSTVARFAEALGVDPQDLWPIE